MTDEYREVMGNHPSEGAYHTPCPDCHDTLAIENVGGSPLGGVRPPLVINCPRCHDYTLLFTCQNNWRKRHVRVYQHPDHADIVISIGECFDGGKIVCWEPHRDWKRELEQLAQGHKPHFVIE